MCCYGVSRRRFLQLAGGALVTGVVGHGHAQDEIVRIGFVLPTHTGQMPVALDSQMLAGEAALMGAVMGEEDFGFTTKGDTLKVLIGSAPNAAAAARTAERLMAVEQISAIVGGFGTDQARALSAVAEEQKIPFLNIGAPNDTLRSEVCNRFTFHVEASAAMYLDALTGWFTHTGSRRWFFVFPETHEGRALYRRAQHALNNHSLGGQEVGYAAVPERPSYREVMEGIRNTEADIVLLLLDWRPQLDFLGYYEAASLECDITGLPYPVTQTRDFFRSIQDAAPQQASDFRAALWEATLVDAGAKELNERFLERWGLPMDPPAWAAYQGVKILSDAITATATPSGPSLANFLESPETVFDVQKGIAVSFRSWDHQLRQPLYIVRGQAADVNRRDLVELVGELPSLTESDGSSAERLDRLGDLGSGAPC